MVKRWIIAIVLVGFSGVYAAHIRARQVFEGVVPDLRQLPMSVRDWEGVDVPEDPRIDQVLGADAVLRRAFRRKDGAEAALFIAYFSRQQVNSQIHSPRNCLPGAGWSIGESDKRPLGINGHSRPTTRLVIRRQKNSQEVLYWFHTQGGDLSGEFSLKWDLVRNSLAGRPSNAALIRYNADTSDSTALREFMSAIQPHIDAALLEAGL
jgi:EpsI family protein